MPKLLEIFRAGTHRAVDGREWQFSEADVAAIAGAYDPVLSAAPLVVGHPKLDDPAYGWVKALEPAGPVLLAEPDRVEAAFADMVNAGRFPRISASLYPKDHPANPKPGSFYLKHVGFLGASAPAVKGLAPASFAEVEGAIEFAMPLEATPAAKGASPMKTRSQFCADCSDQCCIPACPSAAISLSAEKGALIDAAKCNICRKCSQECCMMDGPVWGMEVANYAEQVTAKDGRIAILEVDFRTAASERDTLRTELSELKLAGRRAEFAAFCESLPTKISPAMRPVVIAHMLMLDQAAPVEFGEGDEKTTRPALAVYQEELKSLPDVVSFSETATKERAPEGGPELGSAAEFGEHVDEGRLALHNQALAWQQANPGKTYEQALAAVSR